MPASIPTARRTATTTVPTDSQSARTRTTNCWGSATRTSGRTSLTTSTSTTTLTLPAASTGTCTVTSEPAGIVAVSRSGALRRGSSGRSTTWTTASWSRSLLSRIGRLCCSASSRIEEPRTIEMLPVTARVDCSACRTASVRAAGTVRNATEVGVTNPLSRGRVSAAGSGATVANAARPSRARASVRSCVVEISSAAGALSGRAVRATSGTAAASRSSTGTTSTQAADSSAARRAVNAAGSGSHARGSATRTFRRSAGRSRAITAVSARSRWVVTGSALLPAARRPVSTGSGTRAVTSPADVDTRALPVGVYVREASGVSASPPTTTVDAPDDAARVTVGRSGTVSAGHARSVRQAAVAVRSSGTAGTGSGPGSGVPSGSATLAWA
nr:hypothetical protein [Cellulosimicrobium sp. Marseille-Q4280]